MEQNPGGTNGETRMPALSYNYKPASEDTRRSAKSLDTLQAEGIEMLWGKHNEILRRFAEGMEVKLIAELIGCTPMTVSNIVNSPLGLRRIKELQGQEDEKTREVVEALREKRLRATEIIGTLMESSDEKIALRAAESVLDRTGHGRQEVKSVDEAHMSDKHLEHIKALAAQRGWQREAIDLVPVESDDEPLAAGG